MKIAIIGGGASGMMAAVTALQTNDEAEVVLLERNNALGKKVLITGGGRCNVTTGIEDVQKVLTHYPRGAKFLNSAMHRFPPTAIRSFFVEHGVPLKIEADNRVFPISEKGQDIVRVFEKILNQPRAKIKLIATVERVERQADGSFAIHLRGGTKPLMADRLIIAAGGQAYRQTGSTGDGYAFAQSLGHSLTELHPSLSNLILKEKWPAELSGVSFERANLAITDNKKLSQLGPFLFTHQGISGPAVFALSALIATEKFSAGRPLRLQIDLFPDELPETTLARFIIKIAEHRKRSFRNALGEFIPKSVASIACRELQINPEMNAAEVGKKDLRRAAAWLNAIPLQIIGRSAGEEFVTAGGIPLDEVNPSTMESKLTPGLFFCGEILNVDAFTGGFNLSSAWATGYLAGVSAAT
ncbi:MAG: aminoacetone oxidase family FAD-binding enzyme [Patescibacteria group bacterium]